MIKAVIITGAIIIGLYLGASYLLNSGEFDKFMDDHPDYKWIPAFEYYIGQFHIIFGQWDRAIYRFSRIVEKYPKDKYAPLAQYSLATVYDQKDNRKLALQEYQKLVEIYPDSPNVDIAEKRIAVLK
ncbi:MAG: tetratricopeptide repeat protein [Elusimicrobiota bacterium]